MQVCKPGSVPRFLGVLAIYLDLDSHQDSIDLPTPESCRSRNRTSSSLPEAYLIFQPIRFAMPPPLLSERWALTPPFHPYPSTGSRQALRLGVVYFLWHCLSPDRHQSKAFLLGSMVLFVARTFLPPDFNRKSDKTTCTMQSTGI